MRWLAVLGLLTSLAGGVVGWQLMGQIDTTLGGSLEITGETLTTLEDTIELADGVLDSVDEALVATEGSLRAVVDSTDDAVGVIDSVDGLVTATRPSLRNVEATLRDLASIGSTIDDVLRQLDNIPFGPNYDPERAFGEQLETLADDLDPIIVALDAAAEPLDGLSTATGELDTELDALADAIGEINVELSASGALLDAYLESAQRAQALAVAAEADLTDDVALTRVFIVLGCLLFAAGQIVPWWVGNELVIAARDELSVEPPLALAEET